MPPGEGFGDVGRASAASGWLDAITVPAGWLQCRRRLLDLGKPAGVVTHGPRGRFIWALEDARLAPYAAGAEAQENGEPAALVNSASERHILYLAWWVHWLAFASDVHVIRERVAEVGTSYSRPEDQSAVRRSSAVHTPFIVSPVTAV